MSTAPEYGTPNEHGDQHDQDHEIDAPDAEVFDLAAARIRTTKPDTHPDSDPDTEADTDPDSEADTDPDDDPDSDHESLLIERGALGAPVDPTDDIPARLLGRNGQPVRAIVPEWARSRSALYLSARWAFRYGGYVATYQLTRTPKYAAKAAFFAPIGAVRTTCRLVKWAMAEEGNWALRQHAADRGDADTWLKLDRQRQRQSVWRWWVTAPTLLASAVVVLLMVLGVVPALYQAATILIGVPLLARAGLPADSRITDRVMQGKTYRKLTAELVRRGLDRKSVV